jgi:hypothetical protein
MGETAASKRMALRLDTRSQPRSGTRHPSAGTPDPIQPVSKSSEAKGPLEAEGEVSVALAVGICRRPVRLLSRWTGAGLTD